VAIKPDTQIHVFNVVCPMCNFSWLLSIHLSFSVHFEPKTLFLFTSGHFSVQDGGYVQDGDLGTGKGRASLLSLL
jgi:hypothetical protein